MITRIARALASRFRAFSLKRAGATLHGSVWLQKIEVPRNAWDLELGDGVALDRGITLIATGERTPTPRIRIGANTYINRHTIIDASEQITLGKSCLLGPFCYLTDHDHAELETTAEGTLTSAPTVLGDRVWLGAHVTVLKGVTIGDGAIIGAGSVVTRDIPPGATAVGNPARVIRAA